jgi:hypothetical protein
MKIPSSNPSVNLAWQGLHNWLQDVAIRMVIHDYMILGKIEKLTKMCGVNHQTVDALDPSCGSRDSTRTSTKLLRSTNDDESLSQTNPINGRV